MIVRKRLPLLPGLLMGIMLSISACSLPATGTPTTSSLTPLQVLQNSANAMKKVSSFHIELQSTSNALFNNTTPPMKGTPPPSNIAISIAGSGDEALPNQEQMHLTINQSINLTQIVQGDNVYIQNVQGKWFVFNKNNIEGSVGNPLTGINIDQNSLLLLIQHASIVDHGTEAVNGQSLRHISADLDKEALRQLLADNPQLKGMLSQQNIDTVLNKAKSFKSTIDVWIDQSKFYLDKTQLQVNLTADTTGITSTKPSTATTNLNTIVGLSKFNIPVTITPPTNATPTNNLGVILGLGQP